MGEFDATLLLGIRYALLALCAWALIDALIRPAAAYVAAGKLTKPAWGAITGIALVVLYLFGPLSFLGLPAVVAGIVYLVDVRPALRGLEHGNNNW